MADGNGRESTTAATAATAAAINATTTTAHKRIPSGDGGSVRRVGGRSVGREQLGSQRKLRQCSISGSGRTTSAASDQFGNDDDEQ